MERRLDIQGLRGVAVASVVAFHAGLPLPGGFTGVDVFFVISGYVISDVLTRAGASTQRHRLRRFYIRRFKRLTPALALVVAFVIVVCLLLPAPMAVQGETGLTGLGALLLAANVVIARTTGGYFDLAASTNPLLHTWSLSVEEQFYLVFPLLFLTVAGLSRSEAIRARWRVIVVVVLAAVSITFAFWLAAGHGGSLPQPINGYYSPFSRAWEFLAGSIILLLTTRVRVMPRPVVEAASVVGAAGLVSGFVLINGSSTTPGALTLLPVAGTALLLWAGAHTATPVLIRVLSLRPFVAVGDVSYSWYLWHWPFIVFASMLWPSRPLLLIAAAVVSLVPAVGSYVVVETRARRRWNPPPRRFVVQAAVVLLVPILAATAMASAGNHALVAASSEALPPGGETVGCFLSSPYGRGSGRPFADCALGDLAGGSPIYLIGDSNADMLRPGLDAAAKHLHRPLLVRTASGCPPVLVTMVRPTPSDDCYGLLQQDLADLKVAMRGTVILGSADYYWREPDIIVKTSTTVATTPGEKAVAFAHGLDAFAKSVQALGYKVVITKMSPNFVRWDKDVGTEDDRHCYVPAARAASCVPYSENLSTVTARQSALWGDVESVARARSAPLFDFTSVVCPGGVCSYGTEGHWVYRDSNHISPETSLSLAGRWERTLAEAG